MPVCPNCGNQAADNAIFCDQCGTKLAGAGPAPIVEEAPVEAVVEEPVGGVPEGILVCPACGAENVPGEVFCDVCGEPLEAPEPVAVEAVVEEAEAETIVEAVPVAEAEIEAEAVIEEVEPVIEAEAAIEEVEIEEIVEAEVAIEEVEIEEIVEAEAVIEEAEAVIEAEAAIEEAEVEEIVEVTEAVVEEVYCPTCGAAISADDTFCGNCGASLSGAAEEEVIEEVPILEEEVIEDTTVVPEAPVEEIIEEIVEEEIVEPLPVVEEAVAEPVVPEAVVEEVIEEAVVEEVIEEAVVEEVIEEPAAKEENCPVCGANVQPDQSFCASCGAALKAAAPAAPAPAPQPAPAPPPPAVPAPAGPYLAVVESGAHIPLIDQPELLVGREDEISGIYPDVDMTPHGGEDGGVSRRHAKLIHEGADWFVVDLDSTNGTYVNETELAPKVRTPLSDGDKISFGDVEVVFNGG